MSRDNRVVSVSEWIILMILLAIPLVNIVYFIILLVSKDQNENKKNYAKAMVILWLIGIVIFAIFGRSFFNMM